MTREDVQGTSKLAVVRDKQACRDAMIRNAQNNKSCDSNT